MIDVRSDTVTIPTKEMLDAMYTARVGDDILGDDPTVKELEEYGANLFGKEAALFTVSGTMSNQIAVMTHCRRGDEVILGAESHMYNLEVAGLAALSQVQARAVPCPKGYYSPLAVETAIQKPGIQHAGTGLICMENTYDLNHGYLVSPENVQDISAVAKAYGIPLYLDGARIFNAAAALQRDVKELAGPVDTVQICLTKGLCAPFGSLLMGGAAFIEKARWIRQRIGGGMRQAGYMAAAALTALKTMPPMLAEDNRRAKKLAEAIAAFAPDLADPSEVCSNIVTLDLSLRGIDTCRFQEAMKSQGILVKNLQDGRIRMVCHYGISDADIQTAADGVRRSIQ